MRLKKENKILLGGMLIALLILLLDVANTYRLELELDRLQEHCVEERESIDRSKSRFPGKLICDPRDLRSLASKDNPSVGIQAKVVAAYENFLDSKRRFLPLAIAVFIIGVVPWCWYFLLRRIRELRDAILGK